MAKNLKDKTMIQNRNSFIFYYQWLKLLSMSLFEWNNLPDGCDDIFIEKNLYENGKVIFRNHNRYGLINLSLKDNYDRNIYDNPIKFKGFAGSFEINCNIDNSVIVNNNILKIPTLPIAVFFADKISKIDRIYDINLLRTKNTFYFKS